MSSSFGCAREWRFLSSFILPGFTSVFDAAYYALARFVATQPEVPTKEDGGKTPLGICESCGKIFFKNGNRQKYCDDPECKKSVTAVNPEQLI